MSTVTARHFVFLCTSVLLVARRFFWNQPPSWTLGFIIIQKSEGRYSQSLTADWWTGASSRCRDFLQSLTRTCRRRVLERGPAGRHERRESESVTLSQLFLHWCSQRDGTCRNCLKRRTVYSMTFWHWWGFNKLMVPKVRGTTQAGFHKQETDTTEVTGIEQQQVEQQKMYTFYFISYLCNYRLKILQTIQYRYDKNTKTTNKYIYCTRTLILQSRTELKLSSSVVHLRITHWPCLSGR